MSSQSSARTQDARLAKRIKRTCLAAGLVFSAWVPFAGYANTVYLCGDASTDFGTSCSLRELYAGGMIFVDQIGFSAFEFLPAEPTSVNASAVLVTGVEQGNEVGLQFSGSPLLSAGGIEQAYSFRYKVVSSSVAESLDQAVLRLRGLGDGSDILGYSFDFLPGGSGLASVGVRERVDGAGFEVSASQREGGNEGRNLQTELSFGATRELTVQTTVLASGQEGLSAANVQFFNQTFRRVPEPATLGLVGAALAALAGLRRRG